VNTQVMHEKLQQFVEQEISALWFVVIWMPRQPMDTLFIATWVIFDIAVDRA
jgi:hypothetical protein